MNRTSPLAAVLRIGDAAISKDELARRLGVAVSRFEGPKAGEGRYAQIDLPDSSDPWDTIAQHLREVGPRIEELRAEGAIGDSALDLAFGVHPNSIALSIVLPASVCEAAGRGQIDIEISIYAVNDD